MSRAESRAINVTLTGDPKARADLLSTFAKHFPGSKLSSGMKTVGMDTLSCTHKGQEFKIWNRALTTLPKDNSLVIIALEGDSAYNSQETLRTAKKDKDLAKYPNKLYVYTISPFSNKAGAAAYEANIASLEALFSLGGISPLRQTLPGADSEGDTLEIFDQMRAMIKPKYAPSDMAESTSAGAGVGSAGAARPESAESSSATSRTPSPAAPNAGAGADTGDGDGGIELPSLKSR